MQIEVGARQWPVMISTFLQRSSVSHGDSAQTPWLLCKLKFHSLEKPGGSLKGRLKSTATINKDDQEEIFCYSYLNTLLSI